MYDNVWITPASSARGWLSVYRTHRLTKFDGPKDRKTHKKTTRQYNTQYNRAVYRNAMNTHGTPRRDEIGAENARGLSRFDCPCHWRLQGFFAPPPWVTSFGVKAMAAAIPFQKVPCSKNHYDWAFGQEFRLMTCATVQGGWRGLMNNDERTNCGEFDWMNCTWPTGECRGIQARSC